MICIYASSLATIIALLNLTKQTMILIFKNQLQICFLFYTKHN